MSFYSNAFSWTQQLWYEKHNVLHICSYALFLIALYSRAHMFVCTAHKCILVCSACVCTSLCMCVCKCVYEKHCGGGQEFCEDVGCHSAKENTSSAGHLQYTHTTMWKSPQRKEKHHAECMLHKLGDVVTKFFPELQDRQGRDLNVVSESSL